MGGLYNTLSTSFTLGCGSGGKNITTEYNPTARVGDHICYITNLTKFRSHYPNWNVEHSLDDILEEMVQAEWAIQGEMSYDNAILIASAGAWAEKQSVQRVPPDAT